MHFIDTTDLSLLTTNADTTKSDCCFRYAPKDYATHILFDMDGTMAKFLSLGELYHSSIFGEQHFHAEHLYREGYFSDLPPHMNVVRTVNYLHQHEKELGIVVGIMSSFLSDSRFALNEKNGWIDYYTPDIEERFFVPCGVPKAMQLNREASDWFLVDDLTDNLVAMNKAGMNGIKILNGINDTHHSWQGFRVDKDDPNLAQSILNAVHKIQEQRLMK